MIDYFAIGLSHGLILLAFWRLTRRDDLDCVGSPIAIESEAPCMEDARAGRGRSGREARRGRRGRPVRTPHV